MKFNFSKSVVSCALFIPLLFSAAAQAAETCPSPDALVFKPNEDGVTGKYVVPGTTWQSLDDSSKQDNPTISFYKVVVFGFKTTPTSQSTSAKSQEHDNLYGCIYISSTPTSVEGISLAPDNTENVTMNGWGWSERQEEFGDFVQYYCTGNRGSGSDYKNCHFTLSSPTSTTGISNNPFGKH